MTTDTISSNNNGSSSLLDLGLQLDDWHSSTDFDSVVPEPSNLSEHSEIDLGMLSSIKAEDLLPDMVGVSEALGDEEPFSFLHDWNEMVPTAQAQEEQVRTDLMWSATSMDAANTAKGRAATVKQSARWRNASLTLSECADSLFSDVDLDASPEGIAQILCSDEARIKQENEIDAEEEEEEEIDVVSDTASSVSTESAESSVSHRHWQQHFRAKHQQQQQQERNAPVAAGRSLLRKNHQRGKVAPPNSSWNNVDHSLLDHCYFATTAPSSPESSSSASNPSSPCGAYANGGLLTPNESSDDEEVSLWGRKQRKRCRSEAQIGPTGKRARHQEPEERVKFRFRMAFNAGASSSSNGQRSLLNSNTAAGSKRRSALKNAHCPSPTKSELYDNEQHERLHDDCDDLPSSVKTPTGRRSKYAGVTSDEKCREIRDLHNSMERARRVDLKKHFEFLRLQVPEIIDVDKASKLNILNKASEYCIVLTGINQEMDQESAGLRSRNVLLRKRLMHLRGAFGGNGSSSSSKSKRRTSSGRVSLLSSRLC